MTNPSERVLTQFTLTTPTPYDFVRGVRDHGWIALAPCHWNAARATVHRVERLPTGRVVELTVGAETEHLTVTAAGDATLTPDELAHLRAGLRWMFKLDEDLTPFYALAQGHHDGIWRTVRGGRGRLLRSPTLWEDVVKTICTTNITWTQTKGMVQRLVDSLGAPAPLDPTARAFPSAEDVLAAGDAHVAAHVRMGYRNAYVLQLAREVCAGTRDLEALRHANLPLATMKKELLSIKGIGNYAAHTLLALLGYYSEIAVDTEYRNFVVQHYYNGEISSDQALARVYDDWGEWKYLAYWFDATYHAEAT